MSKNEYTVLDFLLYMKNFYLLFPLNEFTPQLVEQIDNIDNDIITQQLVEQLGVDIFAIPWGHYRYFNFHAMLS